jgi:acyl-CoA reductase-like NAD-dependent aldehyde dehydrogenase
VERYSPWWKKQVLPVGRTIVRMNTTPDAVPTADLVRRCRAAQADWAARPVRERLRPVAALRDLLVSECDRLTAAVDRDIGRPPAEVLGTDMLPMAAACRFLEGHAARLLRPQRVPWTQRPFWMFGSRDTVYRRPHGVVGIIGTWNYPLFLNAIPIIHALTAGNGVVWKPSEVAPQTAAELHRVLLAAGYPPDLIGRMPATREGGAELAEADVDHIQFTGSAAVGRVLARRLGERLIGSTLELSGCDAQIVLPDADPVLAARAAWFGATVNRGQTCIAVRRAFVHRDAYDRYLDVLRPLAAAAGPLPLATPGQVKQAERLVAEAVAAGAKRLADNGPVTVGERACRPTVLFDATPEMTVCREASFAPLLAVVPVASADEAARAAADCDYALGSSVFTADTARGEAYAERLPAGLVTVNDALTAGAHPATPFGGRGASGWGVTQGPDGLLAMTVPQAVSVNSSRFRPHYDLATAGPEEVAATAEALKGVLEMGYAAGWGTRWAGLWRLVRAGRAIAKAKTGSKKS